MPTIGVSPETLIRLNEQKRKIGGRLESHDEVITRLLNEEGEADAKRRMKGEKP